MKNLLMVCLLFLGVQTGYAQCNNSGPVTHYLSQTGTGEIYRPNGSAWKGGDTLKITGTNYSVIEFYGVGGDACRDLVIMPQSKLTTTIFRFKGECHNIKLWGGPNPYGIKVSGGSLAIAKSHHIWADNIECTGGSLGVHCKQDYDPADPVTWQPGFVMAKMRFTNLWVHDINGEGFYIGHTQPDGVVFNGVNRVPIRLDSVEISNCIVERTQWDGIQLSNARNGCKIFNNTVTDYGMLNMGSQQAGIILGSNTNGDVYNNKITRGTGNGIQLFGYGVINCYNNTLENCGDNGQTIGQQSFYASDYITQTESNPKQTVLINNNVIKYPKTSGAIMVTGYANNSNPSTVDGNKVCLVSPPSNWQSVYVKVYTAGSNVTSNVIDCNAAVVVLPVKFTKFQAQKTADKTYLVTFEVEEDASLNHYEVVIIDPVTKKEKILKIILPDGKVQGKKTYTQTIQL